MKSSVIFFLVNLSMLTRLFPKQKHLYHNYLFVFGFLYYLILPAFIGERRLLSIYPGMDTFYAYFPNEKQMIVYYIMCIMLLASFLFGGYLALFFRRRVKYIEHPVQSMNLNKFILVLLIILDQYTILSNTHLLFTGYTEGYHVSILGELATMNGLFLFMLLYNKETINHKFLHKLLLLLVLENSFVLLGFGSRMFVLIPFITCIVYFLDKGNIKIMKFVMLLVTFFILCLIIGAVRGGGDLSFDAMLYIGFAEPLYTWVTAGSYLSYNEVALINYPSNFIGHAINSIPSILFPNKAQFMPDLHSLIYYVSPFGANSLITKLYGNFGMVATPVVALVGGFILTYLRYNHNKYSSVLYYCCCGMIPFLLFRDLRSFNKLLLSSFCIYPLFVHFIRMPISIKLRSKKCRT